MATPILPEENLNDIYKIVNQFSPLEDFCSNLSSNDALKSSCSCYIAALGTMKEKLVQWGEYYQNKFLVCGWKAHKKQDKTSIKSSNTSLLLRYFSFSLAVIVDITIVDICRNSKWKSEIYE